MVENWRAVWVRVIRARELSWRSEVLIVAAMERKSSSVRMVCRASTEEH